MSRWEIRRQAERDIDEQLIYIIRVLHGARDISTLLEKELF